jgi:predicted CXXCH cytochrome family protein
LTAEVTAEDVAGDLTYHWFADEGTFDNSEGDTVTWKAPDDPTVVEIRVHVTDNQFIAIGNTPVGVGMYAPSVTPYFVGGQGEGCTCHASEQVADWEGTAHAHAWATLQESGHAASYCNPCHTVGYEGELGNSGYDEAPIAKFENVQCENCHGPASTHATSMNPTDISVSFEPENCATCHEGSHHPFYSEWLQSPHNFDETGAHGAPVNGGCQGCHEGVGAAERLSGDLSEFYGGAPYGSPPRDTTDHPIAGIVCATCHDPHNAENPGQLRTTADVHLVTANGESPVVTEGGSGKLCMQCHHARRGPESQIENGYDHFGPHANPQADMMAGKSAYHGVADENFVWARPVHLNVVNSCKTCHLNMAEYVSEAEPAKTGHTFLPKVEACEPCHGVLESFDDIRANDDYDGNGMVEGVQTEVHGLLVKLEEALYDSGIDTTGGADLAEALGDTNRSTIVQRESGYNWVFVEDDKSTGIHNPFYCVQLLQQSYNHLTGEFPKNAAIIQDENYTIVRNP